MSKSTHDYDVLVIGAGPAGCAAAAVLAEHGHEVAILEREPLPRYRVGESLIPYCWFALDRLGVVEQLNDAGFTVPKHSVQFVSTAGVRTRPFYFFEHYDHPSAQSWQVVRSDFDQLLLDAALGKGAELLERTTAKELLREGERVVGLRVRTAEGKDLELRARVTIDASGRDLFAASLNRWRVLDEKLKKIAIWTYYEGAQRDAGLDEGATTIAYLPHKGWFWYLPQADDKVSVGIVAEANYLFGSGKDPASIWDREVERQPWIAAHLEPGKRISDFLVTRDFSYRSKHSATDGLLLTGDAFAFLDPVFSSGVFFALHGGVLAGDAVHAALEAGDVSAGRFEEYSERLCGAIEAMRGLVHAFYDEDFRFSKFLAAHPECTDDVTDVLIGNLERDFGHLFTAMSDFADIPDPLPHGRPLAGDPNPS